METNGQIGSVTSKDHANENYTQYQPINMLESESEFEKSFIYNLESELEEHARICLC